MADIRPVHEPSPQAQPQAPAQPHPQPTRLTDLVGLPAPVVILLGLASAVILLGGLRAAASVVGPIVLAFVIAVGVYPVQQWLDRWLPRWAATLVTMLVAYIGLAAFVALLAASATQFAAILPEYRDRSTDIVRDGLDFAQRFGISEQQINDAADSIDPGSLLTLVSSSLSGLASTFGNLLFVLVLLFFLLVDGSTVPQRMSAVAGAAPGVARSIRELTSGIRRFLVVTTAFGAVIAVVDVLILYTFDVPLPLVWGLLAFVTNYIPNVGLVIGLLPPVIVAYLDEGPTTALWVTVLYLLANFLVQTLLQPKIVGDAVGLSVTATVISVLAWGWVLGALGALLAVPLSLVVKELLFDEDSSRGWVSPLLTSWQDEGGGALSLLSRWARRWGRRRPPTSSAAS